MKPVAPVIPGADLAHIIFGAAQPDYIPLPAIRVDGSEGEVITRWELSDEDRARLAAGGSVYLRIWTFGLSLQPVLVTTEPPVLDILYPDGIKTVGGPQP